MAIRPERSAGGPARLVARGVLAALVGGIVGVTAYSISRTGGQWLSIAVGCAVGVAIVLGVDLYRRSAQLAEVKVTILGSEMTFRASVDIRQAAQRMFFQAASRIATRPLDDETGNLREALNSLKVLFDQYREPLESGTTPLPPADSDSVHEIALHILNFELAPFLSRWHPRLAEFETAHEGRAESQWEHNAAFRRELRELQCRLRPCVIELGEIAGLRDPERHLRPSARLSVPTAVPGQPASPGAR
ncbi:hypothetical protein JGS22_014890 [Streptomyces sp. P38-E01]|uniref:Uncharacterized protein n=1 Tax=Streptomyces tardus TaxID=2780544 RepID=A0A949N2E9_9ACTN|nr:hypothetical protein [Streptomyces tardus]MBU7598865.1 hypothetical protein [Streptomyces tardus]